MAKLAVSLYCSLTIKMQIGSNAEKIKIFLTPEDLAVFLSISKTSVYRLAINRKIAFHKIGGSLRFRMSDVDKYLEERRIKPIQKNI